MITHYFGQYDSFFCMECGPLQVEAEASTGNAADYADVDYYPWDADGTREVYYECEECE